MKVSLEETCGDEELLHGHGVHAGEVLLHQLLAVVPVAQAEVLLQVDPEHNNYSLVVNHFHFQCIIMAMPFTTSAFIRSPELSDHDGVFYHFHFQCIITIMPFNTFTFIKSPKLRNDDGILYHFHFHFNASSSRSCPSSDHLNSAIMMGSSR